MKELKPIPLPNESEIDYKNRWINLLQVEIDSLSGEVSKGKWYYVRQWHHELVKERKFLNYLGYYLIGYSFFIKGINVIERYLDKPVTQRTLLDVFNSGTVVLTFAFTLTLIMSFLADLIKNKEHSDVGSEIDSK